MADPGIICYQHCGPKVFCMTLPQICPCCNESIESKKLKLPPFRLPYPFVEPRPCSIILKPTQGDFLKYKIGSPFYQIQTYTIANIHNDFFYSDYYNFSDLHIGVTTSTGVIVEYDKNGIRRTYNKGKNSAWAQSLLVDTISEGWMEHWDKVLDEVKR